MGEPQRIYRKRVSKASTAIHKAYTEIARQGFTRAKPINVGRLDKDVEAWSNANGVALGGKSLYMTARGLTHARRASKIRDGVAVSVSDMVAFPKDRKKMEVFYEGGSFVYTDRKNKFIVHPNYVIKFPSGRKSRVNFITASKVIDPNEFSNPKYKRIR